MCRRSGLLPDLALTLEAHCALEPDRDAAAEAAALRTRLGMPAGTSAPAEDSSGRAAAPLPGGMTAREAEVLRLVARGTTNREIATALFLSERTVTNHLTQVFGKIGVANRAAATAYALRHHLDREVPPTRRGRAPTTAPPN